MYPVYTPFPPVSTRPVRGLPPGYAYPPGAYPAVPPLYAPLPPVGALPHYHGHAYGPYGPSPYTAPPPNTHLHADAYGRPYLHVNNNQESSVPEGHVTIPVSTLQALVNGGAARAPAHSVTIVEPAVSTTSHSTGPTAVTTPAATTPTYTTMPTNTVSYTTLPQTTMGSPRYTTYK